MDLKVYGLHAVHSSPSTASRTIDVVQQEIGQQTVSIEEAEKRAR